MTIDSQRPSEKYVTFPMNIIFKTTTTFEAENAGDWPTFPLSRSFGFPDSQLEEVRTKQGTSDAIYVIYKPRTSFR